MSTLPLGLIRQFTGCFLSAVRLQSSAFCVLVKHDGAFMASSSLFWVPLCRLEPAVISTIFQSEIYKLLVDSESSSSSDQTYSSQPWFEPHILMKMDSKKVHGVLMKMRSSKLTFINMAIAIGESSLDLQVISTLNFPFLLSFNLIM